MGMFNGDLKQIGRLIDVSAVRTDVTIDEIDRVAEVAKKYNCICAFAMPCFTELLAEKLEDAPNTITGGVVGFPSGADTTSVKVITAKEMIALGCKELDMVINVGALKSGRYDIVHDDIKAVVDAAAGIPVKSIIEIAYLTDDEIARASEIAVKAGVTFVKTGTGWAPKPTTVETIKLIKSTIGNSAYIKAAGGVRDLDTLLEMVKEGCSRFGIGMRSAISILQDAYSRAGVETTDSTAGISKNDKY
jgi:deoxyribose-phosphate aldolase